MKRRSYFLALVLVIAGTAVKAQSEITYLLQSKDQRGISAIEVTVDSTRFILTLTGNLRSYYPINRRSNFSADYYDSFDGEKDGKIKMIGNTLINYYDHYDGDDKKGKVKSIGGTIVDYYTHYDRDEERGKMKSVGASAITYYTIYDRTELLGKLKSAGKLSVTYFTIYDRERLAGRIKSISGY